MPNPENWKVTPTRPIRVPLDLWEAFGEAVKKIDPKLDRTKYLIEVMRWVIHDAEGARPVAPKRPSEPTPRPTREER